MLGPALKRQSVAPGLVPMGSGASVNWAPTDPRSGQELFCFAAVTERGNITDVD